MQWMRLPKDQEPLIAQAATDLGLDDFIRSTGATPPWASFLAIAYAGRQEIILTVGERITAEFEDGTGDAVYVVIAGQVSIVGDDSETIELNRFEESVPRMFVGEYERFLGKPLAVATVRVEEGCWILALRATEFDKWAGAPNPLVAEILRRLYRQHDWYERRLILSGTDAKAQIVREALHHAGRSAQQDQSADASIRAARAIYKTLTFMDTQAVRGKLTPEDRKEIPGLQHSDVRKLEGMGFWPLDLDAFSLAHRITVRRAKQALAQLAKEPTVVTLIWDNGSTRAFVRPERGAVDFVNSRVRVVLPVTKAEPSPAQAPQDP